MRPPSEFLHFTRTFTSVQHITTDICCRCSLTTANGCYQSGFVFQQDGAPAYTARQTQEWLKVNWTDFIAKVKMATKLTRPQPTRLPCVGCDASSISQTSVKARDHPRAAKSALQQIWDGLTQTTINKTINDFRISLNACVSADLNWVDALNMATLRKLQVIK